MANTSDKCFLLAMPDVVFEHILSFVSFDCIARCRLVSKRFDTTGQRLLNNGFYKAVQFHSKCFREVKSQLPRRESQRSNHPLARHNNILNAIETRLSLLKMTYCKYMHLSACSFIPGKVLDELFKVLRLVNNTKGSLIPHEVLTELRDISSMAMDYFEEKIVPTLRLSCSSSTASASAECGSLLPAMFSHSNSDFSLPVQSANFPFLSGTSSGSNMIWNSTSSGLFSDSCDVLDKEIRDAINSLLPETCSEDRLSTLAVPSSTLHALVMALKESRSLNFTNKQLIVALQTKYMALNRKVKDQERMICEQSRLLSEHAAQFTECSNAIMEIMNNSVTAEILDTNCLCIKGKEDVESGSVSRLSSKSAEYLQNFLSRQCEDTPVSESLKDEHQSTKQNLQDSLSPKTDQNVACRSLLDNYIISSPPSRIGTALRLDKSSAISSKDEHLSLLRKSILQKKTRGKNKSFRFCVGTRKQRSLSRTKRSKLERVVKIFFKDLLSGSRKQNFSSAGKSSTQHVLQSLCENSDVVSCSDKSPLLQKFKNSPTRSPILKTPDGRFLVVRRSSVSPHSKGSSSRSGSSAASQ